MSKIKCVIVPVDSAALAHKPDLIVNGRAVNLEYGVEQELDKGVVEAAEQTDRFVVRRIDKNSSPAEDSGEGDGAAAQPGGSAAGGADTVQNEDAPDRTTTDIQPAEGVEPAADTADDAAETVQNDDAPDGSTTDIDPDKGGVPAEDFDAGAVVKGKLSGDDGVEARIAKVESVDHLDAILKAEDAANDGKDGRQGVKDAVEARRAELTQATEG